MDVDVKRRPARPCRRPLASAAGFTLVELMIVVAIIGLLSAIAIPAFTRYVKKSRTAEVAGQLNRLWAGSVTYYETDHFSQGSGGAESLPKQFPGPVSEPVAGGTPDCCDQVGQKCPAGDPSYEGPVWQALNFSIPDPYMFKPVYRSAGSEATATFEAQTVGNLDCDAIRSTYTRRGVIGASGEVTGNNQPEVVNDLE